MLNPFPIQYLAPLAYFFLRVVVGLLCVRVGIRVMQRETSTLTEKGLGLLLVGTGSLLTIGLYTQIAALITMIVGFRGVLRPGKMSFLPRSSFLLIAVIALSLFITGAGPFAFDLPI